MITYIRVMVMAACLMPVSVWAGPCEDLAKQAERTGGFWPYAEVLKPGPVAVDGPWAAAEARAEDGLKTSGFKPHDQTDRARLLAEARAISGDVGIVDAWLSPSEAAFDKAMAPYEAASEAGQATLKVHRWAGVNVFAVSIHNPGWYDCQTDAALFYRDPAGVLHYASAGDLNDCDVHSDTQYAKPVWVDGQFAFVDETIKNDAFSSEPDMWQDIRLWQGDHLTPVCRLVYTHDIGYAVNADNRYEDDSGHERPENMFDTWLKQNFPFLMTTYVTTSDRDKGLVALPYEQWKAIRISRQMADLHAFAGLDATLEGRLKEAYEALTKANRLDTSTTVMPVWVHQIPYLVSIKQVYSGKGPSMPYVDVVMYSVNGQASVRVATLTLDHVRQRLRRVEVGKPAGQ